MPTVCAAVLIAGCGSATTGKASGSAARRLLSETFTGKHTIDSGVLDASLTVAPKGSSSLTKPISLDFSGPFEDRGHGQLPESDFTVAVHFEGETGQLQVLSTGTAGYVILDGTAYRLPAASFKQLEGELGGVSGSSAGSASGGAISLSSLGIHPADWLTDPEVVGTARISGAATDHVRGTVALTPLLQDLSKILAKTSTVTSSDDTATGISSAEQAKIKAAVKRATFDLWTGSSDHTIRKLDVAATLPVSGSMSREFGGMTSATIALAFGYSDIGQTETITPPASSKPYAQFKTQFGEIVAEIEELAEQDAGSS